MFAIQQKYDFSSKSQLLAGLFLGFQRCLQYSKSTIFQANHNSIVGLPFSALVVCNTAKVRFFKQITTSGVTIKISIKLFAIQQKYDFSSKSQQVSEGRDGQVCCLQYSKSTIFQANHNADESAVRARVVVCNTAKVRFFKQITTNFHCKHFVVKLFAIQQKYDSSSKSQLIVVLQEIAVSCLQYSKSTIFQANHNSCEINTFRRGVVCNTAKVRFFKQITTYH